MTTTSAEIENHRTVSQRFLNHAIEQFEARDLPQASEKAWGAVAHYLKSEAKLRRWRNHSHRDLRLIVEDLAQETRDPDRVDELFAMVERLHVNFYEDWNTHSQVARGIRAAIELIERLENRTVPPREPRPSQTMRGSIPPRRFRL